VFDSAQRPLDLVQIDHTKLDIDRGSRSTGCALGLRGEFVWKPYRILVSPDSSQIIRSAPCPMREYVENEETPAISRDSDQF
jgi:hypothetical protein